MMGLHNEVSRIAKLTREALLLEALREFPDVSEEELIWVLESWKILRNKTAEEMTIYVETGCWPDRRSVE
jgi:hypothetical protein